MSKNTTQLEIKAKIHYNKHMKNFYHGSTNANLTCLNIISKCNENPSIKCAYVTDNYYYALFYIRDMDINIVTAWVDSNGVACYEEQFENQLEVSYKNQKGYIYHCKENEDFKKSNTNGIYYSALPVFFEGVEKIEDAYSKITESIKNGKIKIKKFKDVSKERIALLYESIASKILKNNFFENNQKLNDFYRKYYHVAWGIALKKIENQKRT